MEQQQKKQQESATEQESSNAAAASSSMPSTEAAPDQVETEGEAKTFEDMSVDELNTLSPEQRRDQMLQALHRRTSGSS